MDKRQGCVTSDDLGCIGQGYISRLLFYVKYCHKMILQRDSVAVSR